MLGGMRRATAILILTWYAQCLPAQECTFDQEHQAQVIQNVFQAFPGASRSTEDVLTWELSDSARETFSYGGCFDFGSVISNSTNVEIPRSRESVMQIAMVLAEKFWGREFIGSSSATVALASAVARDEFKFEPVDGGEIYHVPDPMYVQFYIEHRFQHGTDTVAVVYQGLL